MDIRLLPMSKMQFEKVEDVLDFLMNYLPQNGGNYYYRRKSIAYKEDMMIAFQYDGGIVASALLVGQSSEAMTENGIEYKGFYQFDPNSFVECKNPIRASEIRDIMPEFKGFNQSTQFLSRECVELVRVH